MPEVIRCIVCDKPVRAGAQMVNMRTDGLLFAEDYAYRVRPSNDQGWFEIGPDCYKRVAAAGRNGLARRPR